MSKQMFYKELNKFSYYNAFYRAKDVLPNKEIISIKKTKEKGVEISLTKKGIALLKKLNELNEIYLSNKFEF